MGILTDEMQRVVEQQRLGFVATTCPDGSPNLSPKGTLAVWDADHLIFADVRSPRSVANLRQHPRTEINVVDPIVRKGYRFKGTATIYSEGEMFEKAVAFYRKRGSTSTIRSIVLIHVERAAPLTSPAYDSGRSEDDVKQQWWSYFTALYSTSS
jgi:predicted pyridoxine 5'-phosphate oxidase superfamily flavin-nucleotide-binding protein